MKKVEEFNELFELVDEEIQKSQIILMKQNNIKNLLPVHSYVLLTIKNFKKPPIIIEVARKLYKSKASVGIVVATLEKRGLIESKKTSNDKRTKILVITPAGQILVQKIIKMWKIHGLMCLSGFSETEKSSLIELFKKLHTNIYNFNLQYPFKV